MLKDVEAVVGWVGTISTLDMSAYEPMATPLEIEEYYTSSAVTNASVPEQDAATSASLTDPERADALRLRADAVTDGGLEKQLLANASYQHRGFFVVPKVGDIEDS